MSNLDEKKLLDAIEKGVKKANKKSLLIQVISSALILVLLLALVIPNLLKINHKVSSIGKLDEKIEDHDLTLSNWKIFGYKAADFAEAIINKSQSISKLEVYSQEISELTTITDTGLFNWGAFTKTKLVTYYGELKYSVDLNGIDIDSFELEKGTKTVIIKIPRPVQEDINILEEKIVFGDTEKGLLAFGDIKLSPEQIAAIQIEARQKMKSKAQELNIQETAEKFAKLNIYELFNPIIKSVSKNYSLKIEFK